MLSNLFKLCWKWKIADIICYKLTSLVSLQQGNVKKSRKLLKIDESSQYWQRNSSYNLNDLSNFNDIFRKDVTYDNIKSHEKPGFHPLFRRHIFRKTTGVCITASGNILASGNFFLKLLMASLETKELLIFWYVVAEHHIAQL